MKRKNRANAKGRSTGSTSRFMMTRRSLFHSPQYSALSCASRALFDELLAMFNGTNNGYIFLSVRDATDRLGFSDYKAAMAAFAELEQLGFITEAMAGSFAIKAGEVSRARAWRLNWIGRDGRCVGPEELPPLNFSSLTKIQKRRVERRQRVLGIYLKDYQRGKFAVEESTTLDTRIAAAGERSVEESTT